jgi:hypothetical protein
MRKELIGVRMQFFPPTPAAGTNFEPRRVFRVSVENNSGTKSVKKRPSSVSDETIGRVDTHYRVGVEADRPTYRISTARERLFGSEHS